VKKADVEGFGQNEMTSSTESTAWTVRPPAGWDAVAKICEIVFADLDGLTDRTNSKITRDIGAFGPGVSPMTAEDLRWSTSKNIAGLLQGIAERRGPEVEEISFRRLVGQRSARRALPLEALVEAFRIGFVEVWSTLVDQALRAGGDAPTLLLEGGSRIWQWMLATSDSLAEGYNTELTRRHASEARATAHFLEELVRDPASAECRSLASEIGLDPDQSFRILATAGPAGAEDTAGALTSSMALQGGTVRTSQRGRAVVIVSQGIVREGIDRALRQSSISAPVGVGLEWHGLEGARTSLVEAELALDLATARGRSCHFEDDWFPALGHAHRRSVERLLGPGLDIASAKDHLADAIRAFAGSGFSVAEGARRLGVSANAFRYRLTRWEALTGWNPWTHDGLTRSLTALEFARDS
jgi:hypothetical protein